MPSKQRTEPRKPKAVPAAAVFNARDEQWELAHHVRHKTAFAAWVEAFR